MTAILDTLPATTFGLAPFAGRGPLTDALVHHLAQPRHTLPALEVESTDPIGDLDLQTALFLCYELHYRGVPGVDDRWEWHPGLLALTAQLEECFEDAIHAGVPIEAIPPARVAERLWQLAAPGDGPSLSAWALDHGTVEHAMELAAHRSVYQLKEADPHTFAVPAITGDAKAAMARIQHDEYGEGRAADMHATLFADTLRAFNLDTSYGAYAHLVPAVTLASNNLFTLLSIHRRLRGAVIGHLAGFEMNSVGPMSRYSAWMDRLGFDQTARRFYDVHVSADAVHQHIAADDLAAAFARAEPDLAAWVPWGARALSFVEARFTAHVLDAWTCGRSSLLPTTA